MDLFDLLLSLLLSLPVFVLLAILYGLQLLLYEIYQASRSILALQGLITPQPHDLNTSHGRNLTTPFQGCAGVFLKYDLKFTLMSGELIVYPKGRLLTTSHLVCPKGAVEYPMTMPDFNPPLDTITPEHFISNLPFNADVLVNYAQAQTPTGTHDLHAAWSRIGNAIDFTTWMIANAKDPAKQDIVFSNWNLDSDRGYGYKAWKGSITDDSVENVEYTNE